MTADLRAEMGELYQQILRCRICVENPLKSPLPHEPNPVLVMSSTAQIAICGQAPGMRVHQSGKPFTDPSGDRLRQWMGVGKTLFYDPSKIAIIPMGFCFPGYDNKGGDLPPRKECCQNWHDAVFALMPQIRLRLVIGISAQSYHLGNERRRTLTETVWAWRSYLENSDEQVYTLPLPHPSWRNNAWLKKNPWFEEELLPVLRELVLKFSN